MIALALALALGSAQVQPCGNVPVHTGGVVVWWGAPSADLAPVGVGACTGTAWVDPLGVEVTASSSGR